MSSSTSCSKVGQLWSQMRLFRALSSQVLKNLLQFSASLGTMVPKLHCPNVEKAFPHDQSEPLLFQFMSTLHCSSAMHPCLSHNLPTGMASVRCLQSHLFSRLVKPSFLSLSSQGSAPDSVPAGGPLLRPPQLIILVLLLERGKTGHRTADVVSLLLSKGV